MNGYNSDHRYDAETKSQAKTLVDTANSRQQDNSGSYLKKISDRT